MKKIAQTAIVCLTLAATTYDISAQEVAIPINQVMAPKVINAVDGVITQKAINKGIAANDPSIAATAQFVGGVAGTAAVYGISAAAAAVSAPVWATIAAVSLGGALVAYGVTAAWNWIFNKDGSVTQTTADPATFPPATGGYGPKSTTTYYRWFNPSTNKEIDSVVPSVLAAEATSEYLASGSTIGNVAYSSAGDASVNVTAPNGFSITPLQFTAMTGTPSANCPGQAWSGTSCLGAKDPNTLASEPTLSDADKAKPLDNRNIANLANNLWQQAAQQPGYNGVPYDYSNPITGDDVAQWQAANPGSYPTVGDGLAPTIGTETGAGTNTGTNTGTNPGTTTKTTTNPDGSTTATTTGTQNVDVTNEVTVKPDLGTDPGIGQPTLEDTPTMTDILSPVTGLFPELKNYQAPAHNSVCPRPVFTDQFGNTTTLNLMCDSLEDPNVKTGVQAVMTASYAILAILVILA